MNSITFTCEVVTPMFLAGADGSTPELRSPSIKGLLRFWWRSINGNIGVKELLNKETKIFGGGGDNGRRSGVVVRVTPHQLQKENGLPILKFDAPSPTHINPERTIDTKIFTYLAYGTEKRDYFKESEEFSVCFNYDNSVSIEDDIVNPFLLISFFGGIGAKSHNGYGSFRIISCSQPKLKIPIDPELFYKKYNHGAPCIYTAFSEKAKLYKTIFSQDSWQDSLEIIGKAYITEKRKLENAHSYKKRKFIATPIIGYNERHAKQYFLSVTKNQQNKYDGWILFLPYMHHKNTPTDNYGSATTVLNNGLKRHLNELI